MSNIMDGVFAYVCRNNYNGSTRASDQIYNLTEDVNPADLSSMALRINRCGLQYIDKNKGIRPKGEKGVTPDFSMFSFSYYDNNGYKIFTRSGLRSSISDAPLRGTKEIVHFTTLQNIPEDFYVVDLMDRDDFITDIELTNPTNFEEVVPERIKKKDFADYVSGPLTDEELDSDSEEFDICMSILEGLFKSRSENKKLYVIVGADMYADFSRMVHHAVKLLPASLANTVTFKTFTGEYTKAEVDITGVPSIDETRISMMAFDDVVIRPYEDAYEPNILSKMYSAIKNTGVEKWCQFVNDYSTISGSLGEMDSLVLLYCNINDNYGGDIDEESFKEIRKDVDIIIDHIDLFSRKQPDLKSQIDGIHMKVFSASRFINRISVGDYYKYVIEPLVHLYKRLPEGSNRDLVFRSFFVAVVGVKAEGTYAQHFELISTYDRNIMGVIEENIGKFMTQISNNWEVFHDFIDRFVNDPHYGDSSSMFISPLIDEMLRNPEVLKPRERDALMLSYLAHNTDKVKIGRVVDKLFKDGTEEERLRCAFKYIAKISSNDDALTKDWTDCVCKNLKEKGKLDDAMKMYHREILRGGDSNARTVANYILDNRIPKTSETKITDYCEAYEVIDSLVNEDEGPSTKSVYHKFFVNYLESTDYAAVLDKVFYKDLNGNAKERIEAMIKGAERFTESPELIQDFIARANEKLTNASAVKSQKDLTKDIVEFRITHLINMFAHLDNENQKKIVNRCKHIAEVEFKPKKGDKTVVEEGPSQADLLKDFEEYIHSDEPLEEKCRVFEDLESMFTNVYQIGKR